MSISSDILGKLLAYYSFNENTGSVAGDSKGTNDGSINGASWTSGEIGSGLLFDGVDDYVDVGTLGNFGSTLDSNGGFSIGLSVKGLVLDTDNYLFGTVNSGNNMIVQGYTVADTSGVVPTNNILFSIRAEMGSNDYLVNKFVGGINLDPDYNRLVFTADLSSTASPVYYLDVNGVRYTMTDGSSPVRDFTSSPTWADFGFPMVFGARNVRGTVQDFFSGSLDECFITSSPLTSDEAEFMFNKGVGVTFSDLDHSVFSGSTFFYPADVVGELTGFRDSSGVNFSGDVVELSSGSTTGFIIFDPVSLENVSSYIDSLSAWKGVNLKINNPTDPVEVSTISNPDLDGAINLAIEGRYAYVACDDANALTILDISKPNNLVQVGTISNSNLNSAEDVVVENGYAYVGSVYGLVIIDVSDPTNPVEVGSLSTSSFQPVSALDKQGDYIYSVSFFRDNLTVIDVSDPTNPTQVGNITNSALESGRDVVVVDNYAYVAAYGPDALTIIDVSDPTNPTQAATNGGNLMVQPFGVDVKDGYAYVTASSSGKLTIFDVSDPTNPVEVGSISNSDLNRARDVSVEGRYAYVTASSINALTIIDVSDPTNPTQAGTITSSLFDLERLQKAGDYVFVSGNSFNNPSTIQSTDSLAVIDVYGTKYAKFFGLIKSDDVTPSRTDPSWFELGKDYTLSSFVSGDNYTDKYFFVKIEFDEAGL